MKDMSEEKKPCCRCGNPDIGFGMYGELCRGCDDAMRKFCMEEEEL